MYDTQKFSSRVTQGEDGVYRWTYLMNPRRNKHPLLVVGKVLFSMAALSAVGLLIVGSPSPGSMSRWDMPLMVLGLFAGLFLLISGLLYLAGDDPLSYAMDEKGVTTFRAKVKGPHTFQRMRRVRFLPQHDAVHLAFGVTLYVPQEDYDMVRSFILEHLPPNANAS